MRTTARWACSALGAVVVAAFAVAQAPAAPVADRVSAEVLAAAPAFEGAKLSPSGRLVAAKINLKGVQTLVVTSLQGGQPKILKAGDLDVNSWEWVNDDWLVVSLGNTEYYSATEIYVTRLAALSADMATFRPIDWEHSGQFADDIIWIANDGSPRLLLSKQTGFLKEEDFDASVFEVDVSTGKSKLVLGARGDVRQWLADHSGTVRVGVSNSFGDAAGGYLYRGAGGGEFRRIQKKDAQGRLVPVPVIFPRTGRALGFSDATGFDDVSEIAVPDFAAGKRVFEVKGYDVDSIVTTPDRSEALGVRYTTSKPHTEWFDPAFKAMQLKLDAAVGPGNGMIVSWSQDRTKFLVEVGDASQVGGTYFWDSKAPGPVLLSWTNPTLQNRRLNPVKTVRYTARDGTVIEAVLTLPRGQEPSKLPLIVLPHGGPGVRDSEAYDWWTQFLAEQGYAVIQPNYRGSTGYGSAFHDLGDGEFGLKMQDDLIDAIAWADKQGVADAKRVCIVGASYGGYAAMRGAQRDGSHYRCAISYAGVSDLREIMQYDRQFLIGDNPKKYWRTLAPNFEAVSPRYHAAEFSTPILIMHGARDKRVPVKQSRAMAAALEKAGKPVTYIEQKQGDHHFSRTEDRLEFLRAMKAFLDKHNPAT